jgi:hypothetical protein
MRTLLIIWAICGVVITATLMWPGVRATFAAPVYEPPAITARTENGNTILPPAQTNRLIALFAEQERLIAKLNLEVIELEAKNAELRRSMCVGRPRTKAAL